MSFTCKNIIASLTAKRPSAATFLLFTGIGIMGLAGAGCGNQGSTPSVQVAPSAQVAPPLQAAQADPAPAQTSGGNSLLSDLLRPASASAAPTASRPTGVLTFCEGTHFFDYNIVTRELADFGEADDVYRAKNGWALVKAFNNDLVLVSPDGKTRRTVVPGDDSRLFLYTKFVLSPDGETVIFDKVSNDPRCSRALVAHDVKSGNETMTGLSGFNWPIPQDWTPDGNLLITPFSEEKTTTPSGESVSINYGILSKNLASGQRVYIDQPGTKPVDQISDPRVDPSGKRIAFCWDNQIWTANLDGSAAKQVTNSEFSNLGATGEDEPAWSPDGKWLAVDHIEGRLSGIYLVPVDGKTHTMSDKAVIKLLDKNGSGLSCAVGKRITWLPN